MADFSGHKKTRGEGNAQSKLTEDQVRFIKLAAHYGARSDLLAKHFRVSQPHVYRILHNLDWKWA